MLVLSVETSSPQGSLCLIKADEKGKEVLAESSWTKFHDENILEHTENLFKKSNAKKEDLGGLCCDVGPGSFTGIRVGVNFIKGISYHLKVPIYVENSLKIMTLPHLDQEKDFFCLLNAFGKKAYVAAYRVSEGKITTLIPPCLKSLDDLQKLYKDSYECLSYEDSFLDEVRAHQFMKKSFPKAFPSSKELGLWAIKQKKQDWISWEKLRPLYIKGSPTDSNLKKIF